MRSLLVPLALTLALIPSQAFPNDVPEVDSTAHSAAQTDTLADRPAPWEAKANAPVSSAQPKEKSNATYYGWAFVVLAAAGMTVFLWRSSKRSN